MMIWLMKGAADGFSCRGYAYIEYGMGWAKNFAPCTLLDVAKKKDQSPEFGDFDVVLENTDT